MSKWKPHEYQKRAVRFGVERGAAGFLLDPGLGKTSIVLAVFKALKRAGLVERMLVVAPLRPAQRVWPAELAKWDNFSGLTMEVLHGDKKGAALARGADIAVINPEGLPWLSEQRMTWPWQMLVVDESTRFKHTNTRSFKLMRGLLKNFKRRYILTGSPAPNGLMDLFGQTYLLDLGNALGAFITHFRSAYFDATGFRGYTWVPKAGSAERIYERLAPLMLRMSAADYLDLPPLINNTVEVDLPPAARKAYDQMETLLIAAIKDEMVVAANAAAATGKCRQIANGGAYIAQGKAVDLHEAKLDAVEELVEELSGKPALVAYEFDHDRARLQRRFPGAPHIGGGVTAKRFKEIEVAWNLGLIPVLLAQPQSVSHGLNLQGTSAAVIWHSLTWNLEDYEQFVRRVWRQGQKESVVVHHIVAKDTVDEAIMKALASKDRTQRALLQALKAYTEARP